MVNIWLMMVNNNLVGGAISPSWKMMEFVNGKDDIPYMKWKQKCLKPPTSYEVIGIAITQDVRWKTMMKLFKYLQIG